MISYFIEDKNGNLLFPSYYVGEFLKTTIEKGVGKYVGEEGKYCLNEELSNLSVYKRTTEGLRVVGYETTYNKIG